MENETPALWEILYEADYRDADGDPCMADKRFYVVATGYSEAQRKAEPLILNYAKDHHRNRRVVINFVTLENLIPARNSENDGRLGWHASHLLEKVELSLEEDKKKFSLGVCVIPVE